MVFEKEAYSDYLHSIQAGIVEEYSDESCVNAAPGTRVARGHRISLTFRHKKQVTMSVV